MAEISELEARITAALDRIGAGLDGLEAPKGTTIDPKEMEALRDALEAEKTANAQLEERVKSLREQQDARIKELEAQLEKATAGADDAKSQMQELRASNEHLQASLQALREAAAKGVSPEQINDAMVQELDGLRSVREADRAELDEILGELAPLLKEAENA